MGVPEIGGPQYRPLNAIILITGALKKVSLIWAIHSQVKEVRAGFVSRCRHIRKLKPAHL